MEAFIPFILLIVVCIAIERNRKERMKLEEEAKPTPRDIAKAKADMQIICPHCKKKGNVITRKIKRKAGIHGGKATAAVVTCGLSVFMTGLSQKNKMTEAHCSNCGQTWVY